MEVNWWSRPESARLIVGQQGEIVTVANPYRADHVGSLLRPPELVQARWAYDAGQMSKGEFNQLADAAIPKALAMQQEVGLDIFTDGEYRRTWWAGSLA